MSKCLFTTTAVCGSMCFLSMCTQMQHPSESYTVIDKSVTVLPGGGKQYALYLDTDGYEETAEIIATGTHKPAAALYRSVIIASGVSETQLQQHHYRTHQVQNEKPYIHE